jgi:hypothetical protein
VNVQLLNSMCQSDHESAPKCVIFRYSDAAADAMMDRSVGTQLIRTVCCCVQCWDLIIHQWPDGTEPRGTHVIINNIFITNVAG